jgi:hypothetical protein
MSLILSIFLMINNPIFAFVTVGSDSGISGQKAG